MGEGVLGVLYQEFKFCRRADYGVEAIIVTAEGAEGAIAKEV